MSDDKSKTGRDRDFIAMSQDYEVQYWSKKFNVTKEELQKAIDKVGNKAADVEAYFKK